MTRSRAASLLLAGSALGAIPARVRAQAPVALRIAVFPSENAAEVYYAKDLGVFAKVGFDASIEQMQSATTIATALVANALDIGYVNVDTLAAAHQKGIPLVLIAPAAEWVSQPNTRVAALVVPANSSVRQAKDLNGKIVALPVLQGIGQIAVSMWIDRNGGDASTVKFLEVPNPALPAALDQGHVDAVQVAEPFLGIATKKGRVLTYAFDAISTHFLLAGWTTTPQWAKANPDLVRRFVALIREMASWANKNPEQSGEILAKYSKIDPAVIATMARIHYADQLTPGLMQPLIDAAAKYAGFPTFPARDLMYSP